ncbi:MAG: glycosyltransferase family 2 protein [Proteobacteria bacterium]|nr:glycosyltransferase family 2 protein [Pseudomonadota bacterium]
MKISGFTFVKNALELDYPIVEAITSILPLVDEFWVAAGDSRDGTTEAIRAIGDPKVNIIESIWDPRLFVHGAINAEQTNLALSRCRGDWCFYLQADEVVHEKFLPIVKESMEKNLNRPEVEGLLFDYIHFWGSYETRQKARHWYRREVRVIRNGIGISSWKSAQGFRREGRKLKVVHSGAAVYHYGWVRNPHTMKKKQIALDSVHHGPDWIKKHHPDREARFEYGSLQNLALFTGTHPRVMAGRIAGKNWSVPLNPAVKHEHNRLWNRALTYLENKFLGGYRIGEYKNYILIK